MTKEELLKELDFWENQKTNHFNLEQAVKLALNSIYGCLGAKEFFFYNRENALSTTLQGQEAIKYCEKMFNTYFLNRWHLDLELHKKLNVTVKCNVKNPVWVYTDTDSFCSDTEVYLEGGKKITVKELFDNPIDYIKTEYTKSGHTAHEMDLKCLSLNSNDEPEYLPIKRVIKENIKKKVYKIKASDGKEITLTGDHTLLVSRDGVIEQIKVKDVLKTDKLISVDI